jgi:hypothetical protein
MQNLMKREETLPGYFTCSESEDLLQFLRNLNFHSTSTNRHGTFFKSQSHPAHFVTPRSCNITFYYISHNQD